MNPQGGTDAQITWLAAGGARRRGVHWRDGGRTGRRRLRQVRRSLDRPPDAAGSRGGRWCPLRARADPPLRWALAVDAPVARRQEADRDPEARSLQLVPTRARRAAARGRGSEDRER